MLYNDKILLGQADGRDICLFPKMANRHGLIAGATGTGKTITLKVLAESFSDMGVPVFVADAKGDLAGMCAPGEAGTSADSRIESMGLSEKGFTFKSYPTDYWDVYGEKGMPLRTTITEMGPLLLSRIMDLNDVQTDILNIVFKIADDEGMLLIDTKDLRSMLRYVGDNAKEYSLSYGNIAPQSLAAITRALVALESNGGEIFFGEPALDIRNWLATDADGRGLIHVLDCGRLMMNPRMYSMFLLWLISELFEILPEVGDADKPNLVFFFDEAHMLFESASKVLLEKIEQLVKLIRSKGVGIYFITQSPKDIPDGVLAQLGNKVQHALRAYTPAEQKGLKAAAQSFRVNPAFDTVTVLSELGTGKALVSVLDEEGIPTIVEKTSILPPQSHMGTIDDTLRLSVTQNSLLYPRYKDSVDRDSAYEFLARRAADEAEAAAKAAEEAAAAKAAEAAEKEAAKKAAASKRASNTAAKNVAKSATGTIGRELGKSLGSAVGGNFGKKLGGNLGASLGRGLIGTLFKF